MSSSTAGHEAILFLARLLRAVNEAQKQPALGFFLRSSKEARELMGEARRIVQKAEDELRAIGPARTIGNFPEPKFPKQNGGA